MASASANASASASASANASKANIPADILAVAQSEADAAVQSAILSVSAQLQQSEDLREMMTTLTSGTSKLFLRTKT